MPTAADPDVKERVRTKIKPITDLSEPKLFKVIYMNDDVTTAAFVVESLISIFNHSQKDAEELTQKVHEEGSAIVAVLPFELAEQKGVEATVLARSNGFPLLVRLEPVV